MSGEWDQGVPIQVPAYRQIWCELADDDGRYVEGSGVILHGSDVPRETLIATLRHHQGDNPFRLVSEVQHLRYVPRVKWCSRHDGFGCDDEGEWHGHWFEVKHNTAANCCHTVALGPPLRPEVLVGGAR